MRHYQALSALLLYPEQELIDHLDAVRLALAAEPAWLAAVEPLLAHLAGSALIDLQQQYVATFDRNPSHSLHLFEHIHGESRDRGQAMVDLMEQYKGKGMAMCGNDLPDYVPLFLEFLSRQDATEALALLGDAIHVLVHVGNKLAANHSPYHGVFAVLEMLSPVQAEALSEPPVRDMDEALETFGPGVDGVEPLLKTLAGGAQPINFYPKARRTA